MESKQSILLFWMWIACLWIASKTFYCFGRVPATSRQNILLFWTRVCEDSKQNILSFRTCVCDEQVKIQWFWTRACVRRPKHFIVPDACLYRAGETFYCSGRVRVPYQSVLLFWAHVCEGQVKHLMFLNVDLVLNVCSFVQTVRLSISNPVCNDI
jgi:hypothetical protein